jgi:glycosyltransferase
LANDRPALTIITVSFNSGATIAQTLESVASQRDVALEHLVVDGGSTDDTLAIAGSFPHVARIVQGPDRGMYDAMNKGIGIATGEVVGILNADDLYAGPEVLSKISRRFEDPEVDACYGDLVYVKPGEGHRVVRRWQAGEYKMSKLYWGWMPPHPTFFVRRDVYHRYGAFNLSLGTSADYELMFRFLRKHGIRMVYLPEVLVRMRAGGASSASLKARLIANRNDRKAWALNGLRPLPWTIVMKPLRKIAQFI